MTRRKSAKLSSLEAAEAIWIIFGHFKSVTRLANIVWRRPTGTLKFTSKLRIVFNLPWLQTKYNAVLTFQVFFITRTRMNVKNLFMGDVEPLLMSTIGKIKASKKIFKSLQCSVEFVSFWQNFPLVLLKLKFLIAWSNAGVPVTLTTLWG